MHRTFEKQKSQTKLPYDQSDHELLTTPNSFEYSSKYSKHSKNSKQMLYNMSRIIPKVIIKDKQALYQENLRLKQEIKKLNNQLVQIKTKLSIAETKLIQAGFSNATGRNSMNSLCLIDVPRINHRRLSPTYSLNRTVNKQVPKNIGKTLVQYQQQKFKKLQDENIKIKRSLKYTKINQLSIQNQKLIEQCKRLKQNFITRQLININQFNKLNQEISKLKKQIDKQKGINKIKIADNNLIREQLKKFKYIQQSLIKQRDSLKSQLQNQMKNKQSRKIKTQVEETTYIQPQAKKITNIFEQKQQNIPIFNYKNREKKKIMQQNILQSKSNEFKSFKSNNQHKIISTTLTYRFKSLQYTYYDLVQDIENSHIQQFSQFQIETMLKSQPFHLNQESLRQVTMYIFKEQGRMSKKTKIKAKQFLKKIRQFIQDFEPIPELKWRKYLQKWRKILQNAQKKIKNQYSQYQYVTGEQLKHILIHTQVSQEQLQVLIGEACLISATIDKINLQAFLNKITD